MIRIAMKNLSMAINQTFGNLRKIKEISFCRIFAGRKVKVSPGTDSTMIDSHLKLMSCIFKRM